MFFGKAKHIYQNSFLLKMMLFPQQSCAFRYNLNQLNCISIHNAATSQNQIVHKTSNAQWNCNILPLSFLFYWVTPFVSDLFNIMQFNSRTMAAVESVPPELSVVFPCFHSCFVLLLEGEVCAGLISITVSSFPITPQTPAGCLFTFRNKKWACAREDVPLIRGEAPCLSPQGSTSQNLLPLSHLLPPTPVPVLWLIPLLIRLLSTNSIPPTLSFLSTVFPSSLQLSSCQITSNKTQANGPWVPDHSCVCVY